VVVLGVNGDTGTHYSVRVWPQDKWK
jgi:hypothetical protein